MVRSLGRRCNLRSRVITFIRSHKQSIDMKLLFALALLSSAFAAPDKAPLLALRGGSKPADNNKCIVEKKKNRPSLLAALPTFIDMPALPKPTFALDKWADAALAGLGLAGSFALLDVIGAKFGVKLVVPPMMASGIIFFSPATPPSPRGFLGGTVGCCCARVATSVWAAVRHGEPTSRGGALVVAQLLRLAAVGTGEGFGSGDGVGSSSSDAIGSSGGGGDRSVGVGEGAASSIARTKSDAHRVGGGRRLCA